MSAMPAERLPELMTVQQIMAETGMATASAEAILEHVPVVRFNRRRFVRREDVKAFLAANTEEPK